MNRREQDLSLNLDIDKMNDYSYIKIDGWMINHLKLSGNDLMIYALIFGFSHDGESYFSGGQKYICESVSASKPTVIKSLCFLEEKSLIIKEQLTINGVNFNKYRANLLVVKKLYFGGKETLPNNTINNIHNSLLLKEPIVNNKPSREKNKFTPPDFEEVKNYFIEKGYTESSAKTAFDYYEAGNWTDKNGNPVKNWKQKMIAVWFKDENKIQYSSQSQLKMVY